MTVSTEFRDRFLESLERILESLIKEKKEMLASGNYQKQFHNEHTMCLGRDEKMLKELRSSEIR